MHRRRDEPHAPHLVGEALHSSMQAIRTRTLPRTDATPSAAPVVPLLRHPIKTRCTRPASPLRLDYLTPALPAMSWRRPCTGLAAAVRWATGVLLRLLLLLEVE